MKSNYVNYLKNGRDSNFLCGGGGRVTFKNKQKIGQTFATQTRRANFPSLESARTNKQKIKNPTEQGKHTENSQEEKQKSQIKTKISKKMPHFTHTSRGKIK